MSRPPTQLEDDDYQYRVPSAVAQKNADVIVDQNPQSNLQQQQQQQQQEQTPVKPKRKLSVPPRYRCRVCHKTYLGWSLFIPLNNGMNNQVVCKTTCRVARIYFASELVNEYKDATVYIES